MWHAAINKGAEISMEILSEISMASYDSTLVGT